MKTKTPFKILGLLVLTVPFIGFPNWIENIFFIFLGLLIFFLAFFINFDASNAFDASEVEEILEEEQQEIEEEDENTSADDDFELEEFKEQDFEDEE